MFIAWAPDFSKIAALDPPPPSLQRYKVLLWMSGTTKNVSKLYVEPYFRYKLVYHELYNNLISLITNTVVFLLRLLYHLKDTNFH